ncbi:MAG: prepilin-type N-terminal cleavage/methylation domain-containing protein [Candidatus Omnitrophica bacterium]|nr:prepilin-type N-terminal cleavage/methylation domain-containing protein [Candidatus Omnitrophota bacterium]
MNITKTRREKKGFTIIEMVIALVIISVILLVVVPLGQAATDNSRISNAIASIKAIQTAAVEWASDNGGQYTNITFTGANSMVATGYLPANFNPAATNPWNGDYQIAVDANDPETVDITLTNVPPSAGNKLVNALTKISSGNAVPAYNAANSTFMLALK